MNAFDAALVYGFVGGVATVGMVLLFLHVARSEEALRADTAGSDSFRIVRVCRVCHRYVGPDRKILAGQHLTVHSSLCPICAKRRVMSAANP